MVTDHIVDFFYNLMEECGYKIVTSSYNFSIINIETKIYENSSTTKIKTATIKVREQIKNIMDDTSLYSGYDIFDFIKNISDGDYDCHMSQLDNWIDSLVNYKSSPDNFISCIIDDNFQMFFETFCKKNLKKLLE